MKVSALIKTGLFIALLIVAHILFGIACNRVQSQYATLFTPGKALLNLAVWAFGSILLVVLTGGLVAALVRPFWVIALGFALSALALVLAWGINLYSGVAALVYLLIAIGFANNVLHEMNNRLNFSVRPIQEEQKLLLFGLALLVGVSFALGYQKDAQQSGVIIPPAYKQTVMAAITRSVGAQIEKQSGLGPAEKAMALQQMQQMQQEAEKFWTGVEKALQPYALYFPIGLAALMIWLLETLFGFIAWVPPVLLSTVFPLLKAIGVTHEIIEAKEIRRLTLE